MPMIDVYAPADLFPAGSDRQVGKELTLAVLRAEGKDATAIVARISGDPTQASRTWVLLTETAEGGWGLSGTAFGREEFVALATKASSAH